MLSTFRLCIAILTALLLLSPPSFGYQSPLSDESVREAYFLGQRHDASFLSDYVKLLPPSQSGPHIASISFLTPFAQLVQLSDRHIGSYSAQQARLDHLDQKEFVKITVEIHLTASYGALIADSSGSRSGGSPALVPRPYDFWKDFRVQVHDGNHLLSPVAFSGHPLYRCGRTGPCRPMGAILELEFPAGAFTGSSATVLVLSPEGETVSADFNLSRLR